MQSNVTLQSFIELSQLYKARAQEKIAKKVEKGTKYDDGKYCSNAKYV